MVQNERREVRLPGRPRVPLIVRFAKRVVRRRGCWGWLGARTDDGYGVIKAEPVTRGVGAVMRRAHRVAWELAHGPVPRGMCVLHKCDNPPCTNPKHLFLGTQAENSADRSRKGRSARTGHSSPGEAHPGAKLTDADVRRIRKDTRPTATIARALGMSDGAIQHIRKGRAWRHVK